jgi:hypothetical protein
MKIMKATALTLLAVLVGTFAYLASQTDPGKVQREIDKSPMVAPNGAYRIRVPCWPVCDDQHQEVGKAVARIVNINNQQPIKKVEKPTPVDMNAFRRALERKNVIEVTDW